MQLVAKKTISLLLVACVALLGSARSSALTQVSASNPTVSSDRQVYSPGDTVVLTGDGWSPDEVVHLAVNDNVGNTWSWTGDVTADADGAFSRSFALPSSFVATYSVTATGDVSATATTTFFDDNTIITGPATANAGDTKSYSASKNGNGCTTTSGSWTIAPAGASIVSQTQTSASVQFSSSGTYTLTSTWNGTNNGTNPCAATGTLTIVVAAVAQPTAISQVSGAGTYGEIGRAHV